MNHFQEKIEEIRSILHRKKSAEELRIPFALNENGALVSPSQAERKTQYFCPECNERVILRDGGIKRAHFSHYRVPESCLLMGESWEHHLAKKLIFHVFSNARDGKGPHPKLVRKCKYRHPHTVDFPCAKFEIKLESTISGDAGVYRPDVLFSKEGKPYLGLEVFSTHPVPSEKESKLDGQRLVELVAFEIIDNPYEWNAFREWNLTPFNCVSCSELEVQQQEKKIKDAEESKRRKIEAAKLQAANKRKAEQEEERRQNLDKWKARKKAEAKAAWKNQLELDSELEGKAEILEVKVREESKFARVFPRFIKEVEHCPINKRNFYGLAYANVVGDCDWCPFCLKIESVYSRSIGIIPQKVYCLGRIKDERISNRIRFPETSENFWKMRWKNEDLYYTYWNIFGQDSS